MNSKANGSASFHVIYGAGGTKALVSGVGAVLAFWVAELYEWASYGGASGGTIPAILMASGRPPRDFLADVIEPEFDRVITARSGLIGQLLAIFRKYYYERNRPRYGVWGTAGFRKFVDDKVPEWPRRFWAVAACDHGQVLFTDHGTFKYPWAAPDLLSDEGRKVADQPPKPGIALCASCAMPGILDSTEYNGEHLFDGALAGDGDTPIGVIPRHFGGSRADVIAIDVGDDSAKQNWFVRALFHLGCGGYCGEIAGRHARQGDAGILIDVPVEHFHALQFSIPRGAKWRAIISGFCATAKALERTDLVDDETRKKLADMSADLRALEAVKMSDREFACKVEHYLAGHGLYVPSSCGR
jgi:hypothetical protein